jgi:hypothetical protein
MILLEGPRPGCNWRETVARWPRISAMRTPLIVVGLLALLIGLLWIGQGTGVVNWPQSSFMISQTRWAYYGAALAAFGLGLIWFGRR